MSVPSEFRLPLSLYFLFLIIPTCLNGLNFTAYSTGIYQLSTLPSPSDDYLLQVLRVNYFPVAIFNNFTKAPVGSFYSLIIRASSTDTFNTNQTIGELKTNHNWNSKTKLILRFVNPPRTHSPYHDILREFSREGIFQVVVLYNPKPNPHIFFGLYHNPFEPIPSRSFTTRRHVQPHSIALCFPDKVRNHHGHKFNLRVYLNNPWSIYHNNTFTGLNRYTFDILMEHWNATYDLQVIPRTTTLADVPEHPTTSLWGNRFPFINMVHNHHYDLVPDKGMYRMGILITSRRIVSPWQLMKIFFSPTYLWVNALFVLTVTCLFNRLVLQRHGMSILEYNVLVPIMLLQSTNLRRLKDKRFARISVATVCWFVFFMVAIFTCFLTSQIVTYIPDERIRTIDQLMGENMSINGESHMKVFIKEGGYGLPEGFADSIHISNISLWSLAETRPKSAYLVDMELQKYFLESATNLNVFGHAKYYALDRVIVTLPTFYILPRNSPYTEPFGDLISSIDAAGLLKYWLTKEIRPGNVPNYLQFSTKTMQIRLIPQDYKQVEFIFIILFIGYIISALVFVGEIVVDHRASSRQN